MKHPKISAEALTSHFVRLARNAHRIGKCSSDDIVRLLSSALKERAAPESLLRRIEALTRDIEHVRRLLDVTKLITEADPRSRKADQHVQRLLQDKTLFEPGAFADRLGWTRQALSKALTARRVFFVESRGTRYYPAFFADPRYERRHLEAISRLLGDLPGSAKLQFFMAPKASLGGATPLDALLRGRYAVVREAAEAYVKR